MSVPVLHRPYFRNVTVVSGSDRGAWEQALDLWALALARALSLASDEARPNSEEPSQGGRGR